MIYFPEKVVTKTVQKEGLCYLLLSGWQKSITVTTGSRLPSYLSLKSATKQTFHRKYFIQKLSRRECPASAAVKYSHLSRLLIYLKFSLSGSHNDLALLGTHSD
jgi:hypothetical protein